MPAQDLRNSPMMAHLLDALDDGKDIGHYGRLVFTMVARHFMDEDELVKTLSQDKDFSEEQARGLVAQVQRPPLRKLGVFELDEFFPPADRTKLAPRLNAPGRLGDADPALRLLLATDAEAAACAAVLEEANQSRRRRR